MRRKISRLTVDLSNSDIFRAFACQELFYDLEDREGGKHAIIKKVIEELCIDEEKFNCPRPYDDTHFANNGKLNRKVGHYLFHFNMTIATEIKSFSFQRLKTLK